MVQQPKIIETYVIDELPLHIFCDCLNKNDFSGFKTFFKNCPDVISLDALSPIPNISELQTNVVSNIYNDLWLNGGFINYVRRSKSIEAAPELSRVLSGILTCRLRITRLNEIINLLNKVEQAEAPELVLSSLKIIDFVEINFDVVISPYTIAADKQCLLNRAAMDLFKYNRFCAELPLCQPQHTKQYFISTISKIENENKLFGDGVTPEQIFNDITVGEFIEYANSLTVF